MAPATQFKGIASGSHRRAILARIHRSGLRHGKFTLRRSLRNAGIRQATINGEFKQLSRKLKRRNRTADRFRFLGEFFQFLVSRWAQWDRPLDLNLGDIMSESISAQQAGSSIGDPIDDISAE
ncbi:MAG: hypothetical protein WCL32_04820 [Planctomycetota bacterium]